VGKNVTVRFDEELLEKLERFARSTGMSKAEAVRFILSKWFARTLEGGG